MNNINNADIRAGKKPILILGGMKSSGYIELQEEAALPEPIEISSSDEIIWSANTERSSNGTMVGEAIAEKNDFRC